MVYELVGFNTDSRYQDDVRWREYTTSEKRAREFEQIRKVQFSDSGHGIVFQAREMQRGEARKPIRRALTSHVPAELARIKRESKWPKEVRDLVDAARLLAPGIDCEALTAARENGARVADASIRGLVALAAAVQALEPQS
jgi:hypothetical protein